MKTKKKGLGKGLDALLGSTIASAAQPVYVNQERPSETVHLARSLKTGVLLEVPVELCQRGKYQPRRDIDQASLDELAASIRSQGVMQPIILRALGGDQANEQNYEIIAGERRWRAAQQAGLMTVPAVIKEVEDETAMAMALVENLQREDLNPMEEAYALTRLNQEFDLTHQQVADIVGKSRVTVSNMLRLMNLVDEVKRLLEHGDIEMGHARALLGLVGEQQLNAAKEVVNRSLNVRQTELLVKNYNKTVSGVEVVPVDPNIRALENQLGEKFGLPVSLTHNSKGAGKLTIKYHSLDELDGILDHIK
tara:strand:+ start:7649 stop:8572 length:924 start_codon:yes stop_codon:yes gene_type:complete